MTLGEQIKAARKAADMTQLGLAQALGQHDSRLVRTYDKTVGAWERDEVPRLPFYVIVAIADATDQPIDRFAEGVRSSRPTAADLDKAKARAARVGRRVQPSERPGGNG